MANTLELDAVHYKNHSISQYSQAGQLLKLVDIKDDFSILDVGCGHGNILAELSMLVPKGRAIGIDASQNMISLAKLSFPKKVYKNLNFRCLRAEQLSFPDQSFDLIICTNVLMWVRKPKAALEKMCSLLKKNGTIIIFTYPNTTPYAKLFESALNSLFPDLLNESAVKTMLSPIEHREILQSQDLKISLFSVDDISFSYEDKTDFKNYVRGWLNCYAPIPEKFQDAFLNKICDQAKQQGFCDHAGRFSIPHQTLRIVANNPWA